MTLRRKLLAAIVVAVLAGAGGIHYWLSWLDARPTRFVERWGAIFQRCGDATAYPEDKPFMIRKLPDGDVVVRSLSDGQWVAVASVCSCQDGFDASVFYDSSGLIQYNTEHHFCGYEGLCGGINGVEASGLAQFYKGLGANGVVLHKWGKSVSASRPSPSTQSALAPP
jgi:hypothetical protein